MIKLSDQDKAPNFKVLPQLMVKASTEYPRHTLGRWKQTVLFTTHWHWGWDEKNITFILLFYFQIIYNIIDIKYHFLFWLMSFIIKEVKHSFRNLWAVQISLFHLWLIFVLGTWLSSATILIDVSMDSCIFPRYDSLGRKLFLHIISLANNRQNHYALSIQTPSRVVLRTFNWERPL